MQGTYSSPHSSCFLTSSGWTLVEFRGHVGWSSPRELGVSEYWAWRPSLGPSGDIRPHSITDLHAPGLWECPLPTWPFSYVAEPQQLSTPAGALSARKACSHAEQRGGQGAAPQPRPSGIPCQDGPSSPSQCCVCSGFLMPAGGGLLPTCLLWRVEKGWEAEGRAVPSEPRQGWSLHVCKGSRDVGLAGRRRGARPCLQEVSSQEPGGLSAEERVNGVRTALCWFGARGEERLHRPCVKGELEPMDMWQLGARLTLRQTDGQHLSAGPCVLLQWGCHKGTSSRQHPRLADHKQGTAPTGEAVGGCRDACRPELRSSKPALK